MLRKYSFSSSFIGACFLFSYSTALITPPAIAPTANPINVPRPGMKLPNAAPVAAAPTSTAAIAPILTANLVANCLTNWVPPLITIPPTPPAIVCDDISATSSGTPAANNAPLVASAVNSVANAPITPVLKLRNRFGLNPKNLSK